MREIKFRVYEKQSKEFNYFTFSNILQYREVFQRHVIHGNTFRQYSGIKDINNKDIYEGDVCTCNHSLENCIVEYRYSSFYLKTDIGYIILSSIKGCKIIGNIDKNPELIGE